MRIVWTAAALRDLEAQIEYLDERNPDAAHRVQMVIREAIERLAEHPYRGRPGRRADTRELVILGLPYLIVYAVGETAVTVLRVLHTAQRWP